MKRRKLKGRRSKSRARSGFDFVPRSKPKPTRKKSKKPAARKTIGTRGPGKVWVEFDRARSPRVAVVHRPGKKPFRIEAGKARRGSPLVDPDTGARIPLLERASLILHPRAEGLSRGFDIRSAARARRIMELTTGKPVRRSRRRLPWERLTNPVPGVRRDPKTGRFKWPKKFGKNHVFKFALTFRGVEVVGEATRDDLVRKVLGALGATKLTDAERARLWSGPSGRAAAAAATGVDLEDVPESFAARQRFLSEEGVAEAGFELRVFE